MLNLCALLHRSKKDTAPLQLAFLHVTLWRQFMFQSSLAGHTYFAWPVGGARKGKGGGGKIRMV